MKALKSVGDVERELRDMDKLRDEVKKLKAELDESKEAVKAYMKSEQMTTFETSSGCSATYYEGKKKRFNSKAFAEEHPRMYEKYMQDEDYNQLYFKVR